MKRLDSVNHYQWKMLQSYRSPLIGAKYLQVWRIGLSSMQRVRTAEDPEVCEIGDEWTDASLWGKWMFAASNRMLDTGRKKTLEYEDLMKLPDRFKSLPQFEALQEMLPSSRPFFIFPKLLVALTRANYMFYIYSIVFGLVEGALRLASPITLIYLLRALEDTTTDGNTDALYWATVLAVVNIIQAVEHHFLAYFCYIYGWNWKVSATALIYNRLFRLQGGALQSSGTTGGKLVNLISNDVARFEDFASWSLFLWCSPLEVIATLVILIYILDDVPSAIAGVSTTFLVAPAMILIAKKFALFRSQTAAATDQRVRYISEVIDGISTVKSYAWETPFFYLIRRLRKQEITNIASSQVYRSINQGLTFSSTTVASFVTFTVYWFQGKRLTAPVIFAVLSLLQVLKQTVGRNWTRCIETGSEAITSALRIEQFLELVEMEENGISSSGSGNTGSSSSSGAKRGTKKMKKSDYTQVSLNDQTIHGGTSLDELDPQPDRQPAFEDLEYGKDDNDDDEVQVELATIHTTSMEEEGILPSQFDGSSGSGSTEVVGGRKQPLLEIRRSSYYYTTQDSGESGRSSRGGSVTVLHDIEFTVNRNEILMVIGPVGCGKSSLLSAVLNEINVVKSHKDRRPKRFLRKDTRLAYCAQRPFVTAASVKKNITLAGNEGVNPQVEADLYRLAVESSLIVDDLIQFSAYDETEVGERGISVSGGQKARIAIARAVYSDADLYLLDDPLSAVDAHVGQALFFRCIQGAMKNRNKGVILVTHQLQYLKYADKILCLDTKGQQTFYGTYNDLKQNQSLMASMELSTDDSSENGHFGGSSSGSGEDDEHFKDTKYDPEYLSKANFAPLKRVNTMTSNEMQQKELVRELTAVEIENRKKQSQIIETESSSVGSMSFKVYMDYISSGGSSSGLYVIGIILISQAISVIADYWLQWWASEVYGPQSRPHYVLIFAALAVTVAWIGYYRASAWFRFSLAAASSLHERCMWAVMHAPLRFFISNPSGRILNRFAKDQNQADESLPTTFFSFIETSFYCAASMLLVFITIPWLVLMIPLLMAGLYYLRQKYVASSREIKRMEAVTRSPIYSDFSATLDGLVTLRAYKLEEKVTQQFLKQLDRNGNPWFSFLICTRWLGLRLDLGTTMIVIVVCYLAVWLRTTIDVGLLGLTLVYTLALSGLFQLTVRLSAEVETQMTSIERISAYSVLEPEEGYVSVMPTADSEQQMVQHSRNPLNTGKGHLSIENMTAKYRHDLDPVLKGMCVNIPPGYKVGICGRTGSGKSSTLLALLRLNIITEGDIVLDNTSLLDLDLETARSMISIIPQEPHLFSGTIRFNLDPFSVYTDEQIWSALRDAHIHEYIRRDPLGLSSLVDEGGKNFSVGQRQLLSLARAILRHCKVVLMDEVTASIDFVTDGLIQETIRTSPALKDATIITVAHRLRTIADSDMIVMVQAGVVVETGKPIDLLTSSASHFKKLAQESNEFDEILRIAGTNNR